MWSSQYHHKNKTKQKRSAKLMKRFEKKKTSRKLHDIGLEKLDFIEI
jgi:hypothetical protein